MTKDNKKIIMLLCVMFVLVGCNKEDRKNNDLKELEKDGYQMTLYDGIISSTLVLKKGNQAISITCISALDEWKEVHKDEMNVNAINDNENCVYEIVNQ